VEVEKTLAHSNGLCGAELLWDCALLPCVLNVSADEAAAGLAALRWLEGPEAHGRWKAFARVFPSLQRHGHSAMLLRIALLMLPLRGERLPKPTKPDTHTIARVEFSLMWDRMKMRGRDSDTVVMAHTCALESFEPLLVAMAGVDEAALTYQPSTTPDGSPGVGPVGRVELGLLMKRAGANYPLVVCWNNCPRLLSLTHSFTHSRSHSPDSLGALCCSGRARRRTRRRDGRGATHGRQGRDGIGRCVGRAAALERQRAQEGAAGGSYATGRCLRSTNVQANGVDAGQPDGYVVCCSGRYLRESLPL